MTKKITSYNYQFKSMKPYIKLSLILCIVFFTGNVLAQTLSPKISFKALEYDFGDIKEDGGKVHTTFAFTNLGQQPLMIKDVQSSCGCTTPSYPKSPILPGKTGEIKAEFDPINRPGRFVKSITLITNASKEPVILIIKGNVIKRELTVEDKYPYRFNELRLNKSHISFLKMDKSEVKENNVNIINTSLLPLNIDFENVPKHIKIKCVPATLQAGQTGQINITYDASKVDDWGFVLSSVFLKQNGKVDYNQKLSISVTIEEDYSNLSPEEKENAPVITFDSATFNFGSIKEGESVEHEFKFQNKGKRDLMIRKVKASCGCTAINPQKTVIAPGESSSIKMVFNSKRKTGRQYKTITVISNSVVNPTTVLKIIGTVN